MFRKIVTFIFLVSFSLHLCGCVALLAGAAGGAGTATWLSGKLVQQVDAPLDKCINATKNALESLHLEVTKETKKEDVAQIISNYTDGKTIWIDIKRITDTYSKIEVRVGAVSDKEAAGKILDRIQDYL